MSVARLLIIKLLRSGVPTLNKELVDQICRSGDVIVILEYLEALQGIVQVGHSDELEFVKFAADRLKIASEAELSKISMPTITDLYNKEPSEVLVISRLLCIGEVTRQLVDALMNFLKYPHCDQIEYSCFGPFFSLKTSDYVFPVAQFAIQLLIVANQTDLAVALLDRMENHILADATPLTWISSFLVKNYQYLTEPIRRQFRIVVRQLPDADRFFFPQSPTQMEQIMTLVERSDMWFEQDPDTVVRENQSQSRHLRLFSIVSLLLRDDTHAGLLSVLLRPFKDFDFHIERKEASCGSLARLIGGLPSKIAFDFFQAMMEGPFPVFALTSLRYMMVFVAIDVLKQIGERAKELLNHDDKRLAPFMYIMMPAFSRLGSDDETAKTFLCGLLETVGPTTPIQLQERVIDAVGFVYVTFRMVKHRVELIRAARDFCDELKAIIPGSLDLEFDMSHLHPLRPKRGMTESASATFW
jgi:hypothetical protein